MDKTLHIHDFQWEILNHHKTLPLGGVMPEPGEPIPKLNDNKLNFDELLWLKDYEYGEMSASFNYRALVAFDNGYFVSIINGTNGWTKEVDQYELAIFNPEGKMISLWNDDPDWGGDPIHDLSEEGVEELLLQVSKGDLYN